MAKKEKKTRAAPAKAEAANNLQNAPKFRLRGVYLKDVSFESPLAPAIFAQSAGAPKVRLAVEAAVGRLEKTVFEVVLKIEAEAKLETGKTLYLLELLQGGIFELNPVLSEEEAKKILVADCAAALFPYARQSVAELTRNGGFAPLTLDQVNFSE